VEPSPPVQLFVHSGGWRVAAKQYGRWLRCAASKQATPSRRQHCCLANVHPLVSLSSSHCLTFCRVISRFVVSSHVLLRRVASRCAAMASRDGLGVGGRPAPAWLDSVQSKDSMWVPDSVGVAANKASGTGLTSFEDLYLLRSRSVETNHQTSSIGSCNEQEQCLCAEIQQTFTANCIIIAQFPIENHSEKGQSAELPLKK
jgi:hypothetical protein